MTPGSCETTAFLFLIYSALKLSVQIFKSNDPNLRDYGVFLISLIIAILVFGITDQGFEYAGFYFWLLLAIGEIYLKNSKREFVGKIVNNKYKR